MTVSRWNRDRARRARVALLAHQTADANGSPGQARAELKADPGAVLRYLLADLRHWAEENGISFEEAAMKAQGIYADEAREAKAERKEGTR